MIFVIDFDGTLATEDTVDRLLQENADPSWETIEADWLQGQINAQECMQRQIRLLRLSPADMAAFAGTVDLDPFFPAFRKHVESFASLAVVSDGVDFTVRATLQRDGHGDLPVYANRLQFLHQDRLDLGFPHRNAECDGGNGVCKCAVANRLAGVHGGPVVLIGDGKSDACLARSADIVFAKSSLIRFCEEQGIDHIPFENFGDVLRTVRTWDMADRIKAFA